VARAARVASPASRWRLVLGEVDERTADAGAAQVGVGHEHPELDSVVGDLVAVDRDGWAIALGSQLLRVEPQSAPALLAA
jgi:hypothetical protein